MHKKHIFLNVFQKIMLFACVFCTLSAWADTTTCDIDFTPVTGNSWQNGTPTPTNPVKIESIGTKIGNKYQIPVVAQGKNLVFKTISRANILSSGVITSDSQFAMHVAKVRMGVTYKITTGTDPSGIIGYFYDEPVIGSVTYNSQRVIGGTTITSPIDGYVVFRSSLDFSTPQLEEGSVATPYAPYGHSTTPIYLNAPLRKVGNYADVLDYKKGQIIRNVGVKVLDGVTEGAKLGAAWNPTYKRGNFAVSDMKSTAASVSDALSSHLEYSQAVYGAPTVFGFCTNNGSVFISFLGLDNVTSVDTANAYLAQQYANGTPVTVYYPLATPVVEQIENWSCPVPITDIKIATTKMVDEEFAQAEANLAATVQTIESVVSRTITQTGQIATLQETKQTRPDESCPANMKCLLVQDEDGTPHWYPIIEP